MSLLMNQSAQYTLLDLLPYNESTLLNEPKIKYRVLSVIGNMLHTMIESLTTFYKHNDLLFFDPHVGENLCQIRACQTLDIYLQHLSNKDFFDMSYKQEVKIYQDKLQRVEHLLNSDTLGYEHVRLKQFLLVHDIDVPISTITLFLTLSHFLTKFKSYNDEENTIINYSYIRSNWGISKNLSRRMIHQYQKKISQLSCEFITSRTLDCTSLKMRPEILALLQHTDDDGRHTLPCYVVMAVLMEYLTINKVDILLIVRSEGDTPKVIKPFVFSYSDESKDYHLLNFTTKIQKEQPCFVISCVTSSSLSSPTLAREYTDKIKKIGLLNLIMANMAGHPQYSGKKLTALKDNPFTPMIASCNREISKNALMLELVYREMRDIAQQHGCTQENSNLFFIRHIYTDILQRQLNLIESGQFYSDMLPNSLSQAHNF